MSGNPYRLLRITLISWAFVGLAAWNALRLGEALRFRTTLGDYGGRPGPWYLIISGGLWLIFFLSASWSLWRGKTWGRSFAVGTTLGYAVWYWSDRIILQGSRPTGNFSLVFTIVLVILTLAILYSPASSRFFRRENHE